MTADPIDAFEERIGARLAEMLRMVEMRQTDIADEWAAVGQFGCNTNVTRQLDHIEDAIRDAIDYVLGEAFDLGRSKRDAPYPVFEDSTREKIATIVEGRLGAHLKSLENWKYTGLTEEALARNREREGKARSAP